MLFQILDANYTYDSQGYPVVQLFGPTPEGKSVLCRATGFRPYFYAGVDLQRMDAAAAYLRGLGMEVETVERYEPIGYQSSPRKMIMLSLKDPKEVRVMRERAAEAPGVKAVYETDILFKNRFLIDHGLGGMSWARVEAEGVPSVQAGQMSQPNLVVEVERESLVPDSRSANAPLRHLALDIECLPRNGEMPTSDVSPIILISLAFEPPYQGKKDLVLVGRDIDCPRQDVCPCQDEQEMLSRFFSIIRDYDPDVVMGYNSNDFDIPYIEDRAARLRVDSRVGRDGSTWHLRKIVNQTNVAITGRVVVDLLPIIRSSFSLKQYTLRNASQELLGLEKYDVDPREMEGIWQRGGEELRRFISYSRRDAFLALSLLLQLRLMDKYVALAQASGSLLQDVVNGGQSGMVENLLLRRFRERSRVVPPKPGSDESDERYGDSDELKGGAVLVPEKGLLENVVILDYKSLYPTIMMAHNLCYSTVITGKEFYQNQDLELITSPSGGQFVSPRVSPGIVPGVLKELLDQRTSTKKLMKTAGDEERRFLDARQYAMKILLNSFYGYSGYARARLYSLPLANAVTSFGRTNIQNTKDLIEEMGSVYLLDGTALLPDELAGEMEASGSTLQSARVAARIRRYDLSVVYGDTDSVFVKLRRHRELVDARGAEPEAAGSEQELPPGDAELIGQKIAQTITSCLPPPMELVFEAFARRGIFLAKKRYALWVFERVGGDWRDRIKVRGMETVRRDWCEMTSKTLNRCLELLLKEGLVDDAVEHVRTVIGRMQRLDLKKDREMLDDLTLTRRYTKSVSAYKSKQPHIQLVEKMRQRGGRVPGIGERVPFVIVRGDNRKALFVDKAEDPEFAVEKEMQIDTDYYIEKQLLPPVLRIFESFDIKREQLVRDRRQRNLFDFENLPTNQKQKS
ncbi:MAG: DNA polymerase elongation subunit, partial [Methanosarcinales archaeon]|nr:DNA polymerase elongation subunit [Methanosarcinales archaeon]